MMAMHTQMMADMKAMDASLDQKVATAVAVVLWRLLHMTRLPTLTVGQERELDHEP
jgi:hypothetical protein